MCLSTVYLRSNEQQVEIMKDVVRMESDKDGFILTGLFGEQKQIKGKITMVDFVDEHLTVIEQDKANEGLETKNLKEKICNDNKK